MEDQFNLTADRIDASQARIQRRLVLTAKHSHHHQTYIPQFPLKGFPSRGNYAMGVKTSLLD